MADSLYEELGADKDATQDEIGAAYRRQARKLHPDASGGDTIDEFKRIARAYEILGDEDRRRRYDETGRTAHPQGEAFTFVVQCLHEPISDILRNGRDPERADLIKPTKARINKIRIGLKAESTDLHKQMAKLRRVAERMECDEGENLLRQSILRPVIDMEREAREVERKLGVLEECDEILTHYKYRHDEPDHTAWPATTTGGWVSVQMTA